MPNREKYKNKLIDIALDQDMVAIKMFNAKIVI